MSDPKKKTCLTNLCVIRVLMNSSNIVITSYIRDRGATLRWGGGAPLVTQSWLGGTRHFFLLILYNFRNIGGSRAPRAPLSLSPHPAPWSLHVNYNIQQNYENAFMIFGLRQKLQTQSNTIIREYIEHKELTLQSCLA